ncbi:MAG TPA: hypothetical protein VLZ81_12445 [Blastocatellia bacterium]|nr:hypothetical protein [Blastocatellia bacterium]
MAHKKQDSKDVIAAALAGTLLGNEGREVSKGVWERSVYLGADRFVYQLEPSQARGALTIRIVAKRSVGDYLRWVDGLFAPGELPGESSAIHYRAARMLRELL